MRAELRYGLAGVAAGAVLLAVAAGWARAGPAGDAPIGAGLLALGGALVAGAGAAVALAGAVMALAAALRARHGR